MTAVLHHRLCLTVTRQGFSTSVRCPDEHLGSARSCAPLEPLQHCICNCRQCVAGDHAQCMSAVRHGYRMNCEVRAIDACAFQMPSAMSIHPDVHLEGACELSYVDGEFHAHPPPEDSPEGYGLEVRTRALDLAVAEVTSVLSASDDADLTSTVRQILTGEPAIVALNAILLAVVLAEEVACLSGGSPFGALHTARVAVEERSA